MKWFKKNKKLSKNKLAIIITLVSLGLVLVGTIAAAKFAPRIIKNLPRATDEPVKCVEISSVEDPGVLGPGEPFSCKAAASQADIDAGNLTNVACGWSKKGEWPMRGYRWVDVTVQRQDGKFNFGIQMDDSIDPEAKYELVAFDVRQDCGPDTGTRIPLQVNSAKTISPDEKGPDASWCDTSDKKEIWRNGRCYVCDSINSHPLELDKNICQTTAAITSTPSPAVPEGYLACGKFNVVGATKGENYYGADTEGDEGFDCNITVELLDPANYKDEMINAGCKASYFGGMANCSKLKGWKMEGANQKILTYRCSYNVAYGTEREFGNVPKDIYEASSVEGVKTGNCPAGTPVLHPPTPTLTAVAISTPEVPTPIPQVILPTVTPFPTSISTVVSISTPTPFLCNKQDYETKINLKSPTCNESINLPADGFYQFTWELPSALKKDVSYFRLNIENYKGTIPPTINNWLRVNLKDTTAGIWFVTAIDSSNNVISKYTSDKWSFTVNR